HRLVLQDRPADAEIGERLLQPCLAHASGSGQWVGRGSGKAQGMGMTSNGWTAGILCNQPSY
ncbi:hypothetical protein ABTM52_19675, partial [Acinetobacter baumannii]